MYHIRSLHAKDRSRIYEIMQQDDILSAFEIDFTLEQIDNFLFENERIKNKAIVIENDKNKVVGFGYYGPYDTIRESYIIYRFYVSSIYDDNSTASELLNYIENDIKNLSIAQLFLALTSKTSNKKLQFYRKHNYLNQEIIKNFYREGKDLILLGKYINRSLNNRVCP